MNPINDTTSVPHVKPFLKGKRKPKYKFNFKLLDKFRPNTSPGPLSFMFVSDRSFKFLRFQIGPLSFEFVSDKSFKFLRFQIGL